MIDKRKNSPYIGKMDYSYLAAGPVVNSNALRLGIL